MDLEQKVISLIRSNIEDKHAVVLQSRLRDDLEIDSFGTIMIANAIEDAFGISVDEADLRSVATVEDIVRLLQAKYLREPACR